MDNKHTCVGAFDNEVEEQYVQIEQRLAKVDTVPDVEDGTPNQLQCLMCKRDNDTLQN